MSRLELTDADIPLQYQLTDDMSHTATAGNGKTAAIDRRRDRYPFCLVWGPLPLISSELHTQPYSSVHCSSLQHGSPSTHRSVRSCDRCCGSGGCCLSLVTWAYATVRAKCTTLPDRTTSESDRHLAHFSQSSTRLHSAPLTACAFPLPVFPRSPADSLIDSWCQSLASCLSTWPYSPHPPPPLSRLQPPHPAPPPLAGTLPSTPPTPTTRSRCTTSCATTATTTRRWRCTRRGWATGMPRRCSWRGGCCGMAGGRVRVRWRGRWGRSWRLLPSSC